MAATEVARPFHHPGWVYEEKVDGWRVLAYKDAAGVRLVSRNGEGDRTQCLSVGKLGSRSCSSKLRRGCQDVTHRVGEVSRRKRFRQKGSARV
jgi:hypothetical protein